jgi:hypothetical protein
MRDDPGKTMHISKITAIAGASILLAHITSKFRN